MFSSRPSVEERERIGRERVEQLLYMRRIKPRWVSEVLLELPWVRLDPPAECASQYNGIFDLRMADLVDVLIDLVANQRGPGIRGYLDRLVLSSSARFQASYARGWRSIKFSFGLLAVINELDALCGWIECVLIGAAIRHLPGRAHNRAAAGHRLPRPHSHRWP
ncbi:MAG: hypothetical protein JO352_19400 [Chloroflexi bacterium]|nr:hypothetical protein [Chloroflexota bacterium]